MKLETENGTLFDSPSAEDIRQAIETLETDENAFAILTARSLTYMQTIVTESGLELEYQEGDTDRHFQASQLLERQDVIRAMQQYAAGDEAWRNDFQWQHLDLSATSGGGCAGGLLFLLLTAVTAAYISWL